MSIFYKFAILLIMLHYLGIAYQGNVVLLKGTATDTKGSPLEITFYLVGEDGKQTRVKSSSDGSFSIPISTSGLYTIVAKNWLPRNIEFISISVGSQYSELTQNLVFEKIAENTLLNKGNYFEKNSTELTNEGKRLLENIVKFSKINPGVSFKILINCNESKFTKITRTEKVGKKTRKITITPEQQARELLEKRAESIKAFFKSRNYPERNYVIEAEPYYPISSSPTQAKSKQKKAKSTPQQATAPKTDAPNLSIFIWKIMNMGK